MLKGLSLVDSLGRFRLIALVEGLSYLLLLFIAMPLKYMMDMPQIVTMVGRAHGFLFVLYVLAGVSVAIDRRWSLKLIAGAFVASLIPFATFYLDVWLRRDAEKELAAAVPHEFIGG